ATGKRYAGVRQGDRLIWAGVRYRHKGRRWRRIAGRNGNDSAGRELILIECGHLKFENTGVKTGYGGADGGRTADRGNGRHDVFERVRGFDDMGQLRMRG